MTPLFAVCTFGRVFDTTPVQEIVTLAQLVRALGRFEIKQSLHLRLSRESQRLSAALASALKGEESSARYVDRLLRAGKDAAAVGQDSEEAIRAAAKRLETDLKGHAKRDLRLWSPALYHPTAVKRGTDGVSHVSCLVLDYDEHPSIAEAVEPFSSYFHIVHSTWSHRPERPKFRVILPMAAPVAAADWERVWNAANERSGGRIDPALKSVASTFALPATPNAEFPRVGYAQPGPLFDPVAEGIIAGHSPPKLVASLRSPSPFVEGDPEHNYLEHREDPLYVSEEPDLGDHDSLEFERFDAPASVKEVAPANTPASTPANVVQPKVDKLPTNARREAPSIAPRPHRPLAEQDVVATTLSRDASAVPVLSRREPSPIPKPASQGGEIVTSLERLYLLKQAGALEEREFTRAKALVLSLAGAAPEVQDDFEGASVSPSEPPIPIVEFAQGASSPDSSPPAQARVTDAGSFDPRSQDTRSISVSGVGRRRTLCLDFDGVLHSYTSGWSGPLTIVDPPVPEALSWLCKAAERFQIAIFSVRSHAPGGISAMKRWLTFHGLPDAVLAKLRFPLEKPKAHVYVDDRAWAFEGEFPSLDALWSFEPWHRRKGLAKVASKGEPTTALENDGKKTG